MAEKIKVVCVNRYFRDKVHGVQFTPATGGAVGYATAKQAEKFEGEKAFRIAGEEVSTEDGPVQETKLSLVKTTVEDTDSALTQVKGIGPATAGKIEALGIDGLGKLVIADTAQLANDLGEKPDVVEAWQTAAREIIQ